jgi:hypothetical protein
MFARLMLERADSEYISDGPILGGRDGKNGNFSRGGGRRVEGEGGKGGGGEPGRGLLRSCTPAIIASAKLIPQKN